MPIVLDSLMIYGASPGVGLVAEKYTLFYQLFLINNFYGKGTTAASTLSSDGMRHRKICLKTLYKLVGKHMCSIN